MKEVLLGNAIKADRKKLNMSQAELQLKVRKLAIDEATHLSNDQKRRFHKLGGYSIQEKNSHVWLHLSSTLVSKIERGVARAIFYDDKSLIARAMDFRFNRYFEYEVNPMKLLEENAGNSTNSKNWFDRAIEFEPQYRQAGISILSFFTEIVSTEFPNEEVKIGIIQEGNKVTLRVETPEGTLLKEIEKTLELFGQIIMGASPLSSLSKNNELLRDLKTKLEVTKLELKLRQESQLESKAQYESRITNLEEQVRFMHQNIGSKLIDFTNLIEIIKISICNNELAEKLSNKLELLDQLATSTYTFEKEKEASSVFKTIEESSPGFLSRLIKNLDTVPASILSNITSPWVISIINSLPK